MRRGMSVRVLVVAVICCIAGFAVISERVALAADEGVAHRHFDSWTNEWTDLAGVEPVDGGQLGSRFSKRNGRPGSSTISRMGTSTAGSTRGRALCTASTSAVAANGTTYSMRIDGACGHRLGRVLDITGSMPTGISIWVRANTVDTYDTYITSATPTPGRRKLGSYRLLWEAPTVAWSVFNGTGRPAAEAATRASGTE